jgi:hypothetical protein
MQKPVTMEALAERLAMMGFVIAPHGDHIGLRLSLWTSVRVHVRDGRLSVDAFFGAIPRTRATVFKTLGVTALAFASLLPSSPVPAGIAVVFLALALWGYDALRYTLTESCIAQVRQAYNALLSESLPAATGTITTFPQTRALDGGQPLFVMQDARAHTPVK